MQNISGKNPFGRNGKVATRRVLHFQWPWRPRAHGFMPSKTVQEIIEADKPVFGICLGHQIMALAAGIPTFKMHHGHRGLNHPVKNMLTGKCEVTSQNHGFAVKWEDAEKSNLVDITHVNLNDKSVAGLKLKNKNAFSVQYHPESSPGPHDSRYLFDDFVNSMDHNKK